LLLRGTGHRRQPDQPLGPPGQGRNAVPLLLGHVRGGVDRLAGRFAQDSSIVHRGRDMKKMAATFLIFASSFGLITGAPGTAIAAASYRDVIMADNPMMYWRLGESVPDMAYDETANHRDATYVHQPFVSLLGAIHGDTDTAARFNGVDHYVRWEPLIAYYFPFTGEAWVRLRTV